MNTTLLDREPVLAVCGWSGSGKTTLLEMAVPLLVEKGLRVAVVKHDAHGVQIDREGKDSARFFASGADVFLSSPEEQVLRSRVRAEDNLTRAILDLVSSHDFVFIEGHKETPLQKIWCLGKDDLGVPDGVSDIVETLPWEGNRLSRLMSVVEDRMTAVLTKRSIFGGVLIGGKSRRMGVAKHTLSFEGHSLLMGVAEVLRSAVERIVVLGRGDIPADACVFDQLGDAPGAGEGPLAGLLTAFRWAPDVCWIIAACDMPNLDAEAVSWLIDQRRTGCWAVIPRDGEGVLQPTFALYEPQAGALIEALVTQRRKAPRALAEWSEVHTPTIPSALTSAWLNVNTPEEFDAVRKGC